MWELAFHVGVGVVGVLAVFFSIEFGLMSVAYAAFVKAEQEE